METWRAALCEVCGLAGRRVLDDRYLAGIIEDIKENILRAFGVEVSNSSQVFVGIQRRVSEIMALLTMRSDDAQIIGIYGSAGIGKTTLAKVICDKLASHFNGGCFLVNFTEKNKKQDIVELRRLILRVTGSRVASPQVLLMLDDVNSREQLKELAESRSWFGGSSRILVTSRDRHLFHCYADKTYEIESLTDTEALQLFSWNVFSKFHPDEGFLELSQEVVDYAGGLPLTLNIIGSSLKDGTRAQWRSYIDGIRKANSDRGAQCLSNTQGMVDRKFWNVFKLSFERLEKLEKEVFLHIACFFHGLDIDYIISKLDSLYDHPCFPIEVLRSKSWVKITKNRKVHIHDLLIRMGLQIVHDESPEELGGCSRLWSYKDIIHVIKNKSGTDAVRDIVLNLPLQECIQLSFEAFSYMQGLRMLVIRGVCSISTDYLIDGLHTLKWHGNPLKFMLSNQLCILEWWGYPIISLPANFEPHNLVELIMRQSCIEYLWMGAKAFEKLKHIDLIKSQNLIKTPNFSKVPNLEILELAYCTSLCMVDPSIGLLKRLKQLNLRGCISLKTLPTEVSCLSSLDFLDLSRTKFGTIPDIFSGLSSLRKLHLNSCNLMDESIPKSVCSLSSLEVLDLSGNKFTQIPGNVWQLPDLQELHLEDCSQLKVLSKLSLKLGHMHLKNCPSLYCFCDQIDTATSSGIWGTIDLSFWSVHLYHGKPYRILHLHRRSPLWVKLKAQIFDAFVACGLTMGHGTPAWFNQRSTPSFGSIGRRMDLDLDEDSEDWKGCAIFIDFEIHEHRNGNTRVSDGSNHTYLYFVCRFQIQEVSLREPLVVCVPEVPPSGRHGVWAYIRAEWFGERRNNLDRWTRLEASNATQNLNVRVNHCGLRLVRQHDLSGMYEALRSISPHFPDLQGWENLFYGLHGDLGTLRVSGPIEGNIEGPIEGNIEKKREKGVDPLGNREDNLSGMHEGPRSISPMIRYLPGPRIISPRSMKKLNLRNPRE